MYDRPQRLADYLRVRFRPSPAGMRVLVCEQCLDLLGTQTVVAGRDQFIQADKTHVLGFRDGGGPTRVIAAVMGDLTIAPGPAWDQPADSRRCAFGFRVGYKALQIPSLAVDDFSFPGQDVIDFFRL